MQSEPVLVADIGGTNARFGIATWSGAGLQIEHQRKLPCKEFNTFEGALASYYETLNGARINQACIAVAGPINGRFTSFTNLDWTISVSEVSRSFNLQELELINDFAAVACAIPHLVANDLSVISGEDDVANAPIAVVGPGTGLGLAALVPDGDRWTIMPSEGGHALMPACSELEARVIGLISDDVTVSAETLLSGSGIRRIYEALCKLDDSPVELYSPESITRAAVLNSHAQAVATIEMFCLFLGTKCRDAVLTFGAKGGLYLAGGILPAIEQLLKNSDFESRFRSCDTMGSYLEPVKVTLVTSTSAGLIGAASWIGGGNRRRGG